MAGVCAPAPARGPRPRAPTGAAPARWSSALTRPAAALLPLLALALAAACGPKKERRTDTELPPGVAPQVPPILPADRAPVYAVGATAPRDLLVAQVVAHAGLPWVEALSGAAGRMALDPTARPDPLDARWLATVAGYPHHVEAVIFGDEAAGAFPVGLLRALDGRLPPGAQLGLARARVLERDRWVALIGLPAVELAAFPREHAKGATLRLPADRPGRWTLVSPVGVLRAGPLPVDAVLDVDGEWWLEVETAQGTTGLPLYVDMKTPPAPLLSSAGERVAGPVETEARAHAVLAELRQAFGAPPLAPESTLKALARQPLEEARAGRWDAAAAVGRLRAAGFVDGPALALRCAAPTVPACLDQWMRVPAARAQLLDPALGAAGFAVETSTDGVQLVLQAAAP